MVVFLVWGCGVFVGFFGSLGFFCGCHLGFVLWGFWGVDCLAGWFVWWFFCGTIKIQLRFYGSLMAE